MYCLMIISLSNYAEPFPQFLPDQDPGMTDSGVIASRKNYIGCNAFFIFVTIVGDIPHPPSRGCPLLAVSGHSKHTERGCKPATYAECWGRPSPTKLLTLIKYPDVWPETSIALKG